MHIINKMKQRILTGWTLTRLLYLVIGVFVVINSIQAEQWFGIAFGAYFASMGIFAFGCAGGNCFGGSCATEMPTKTNSPVEEIEFEEIKTTRNE